MNPPPNARLCCALPALALAVMLLGACQPVSRDRVPVRDAPVGLLSTTHGARPGLTLLALHDNENDAVVAATAFIATHGGRLVEVRAQGTRHVTSTRDGRRTTFDPNRVFTPEGVRQSLLDQGLGPDADARADAQAFAAAVLREIDLEATPLLVAVHNNSDGAYSAASYSVGGALARDAAALHLPAEADPDHFFLVTTRPLFDALRTTGYPVVLQDPARVRDDGSLSVLYGRRGLAYVNVEAQHGHAHVQRAMLDALQRALAAVAGPPRR